MAWNGAGVFSKTYTWVQDQLNGIKITAIRHDTNDDDFVSGINNCMTKDGQNSATADLDIGGNKLTNGATATLASDFVIVSDIQAGSFVYATSGGAADVQTLTLSPAETAYVAGQTFSFLAGFTNTTATTLNVSGLGAITIKKLGDSTDLAANDIIAGQIVTVRYDGTVFQMDFNPENAAAALVTLGAGTLSNVVEDTTPQLGGDLDANGHMIQWAKGADVASATALPLLTDGNYFDVTGTTTVTSFDTVGGDGTIAPVVKLHFDAALILTHNATDLILPGGANITTAAGDEFTFIEYAAGDYRCTGYALASGEAVVAATQVALGSWTARTIGTTYQAATDGFVKLDVVYANDFNGVRTVEIYTDSSATPTTIRGGVGLEADTGQPSTPNVHKGDMCPVLSGDYYKVIESSASNITSTMWWVPLS